LADKDHAEMVQTLFRPMDRAVVVRPNSPRAAAAEDIAAEIACHAASAEAAPSIAAGLDRAKQLAGRGGLVCAAGSLYMIGEARRLVVG
jgi:dihydrofolate synthase / folylpolyglutamate synthase